MRFGCLEIDQKPTGKSEIVIGTSPSDIASGGGGGGGGGGQH